MSLQSYGNNFPMFQISRSTMSMSRQLLGRLSGLVSRRTVSASPALADKVTHTGQQWDKDDPRNARFTGNRRTRDATGVVFYV